MGEDGRRDHNNNWAKTFKKDIVSNRQIFDFKKIFYMNQSQSVQNKMTRVFETLDRFSSTHNLTSVRMSLPVAERNLRECLVENFSKMNKESR